MFRVQTSLRSLKSTTTAENIFSEVTAALGSLGLSWKNLKSIRVKTDGQEEESCSTCERKGTGDKRWAINAISLHNSPTSFMWKSP